MRIETPSTTTANLRTEISPGYDGINKKAIIYFARKAAVAITNITSDMLRIRYFRTS